MRFFHLFKILDNRKHFLNVRLLKQEDVGSKNALYIEDFSSTCELDITKLLPNYYHFKINKIFLIM